MMQCAGLAWSIRNIIISLKKKLLNSFKRKLKTSKYGTSKIKSLYP